ncbi:MAG: semialdehyde dehydrogenase [Anaerolineae bacterium]|nr:semialdehyde dehydrogenase [Anaerolineae bacterium]
MTKIAVFGAGGKMGLRAVDKLIAQSNYDVLCVEVSERGVARLRERGQTVTPSHQAASQTDVLVLAVPDALIGAIANDVVPRMKPGAMLMLLDPAAAHAGELPARADIAYFIAHPCHPPLVNDEVGEARRDFFGTIAKQHIVCALMQGGEADYAVGEAVARRVFAPVMNAYPVTVEHMAILEPALVETTLIACLVMMKEAIDEAVKRGVPAEAAHEFAMGHINVAVGVLFANSGGVFSDGALVAIERGKKMLFKDDWRRIFTAESVMAQVKEIVKK